MTERQLVIDEVLRRRAADQSFLGIAAALGLSKGTVAGICHRARQAAGLAPPSQPRLKAAPTLTRDTTNGCRFIAGEPAGVATVYCDAQRKAGSSYCSAHHARCYRPRLS